MRLIYLLAASFLFTHVSTHRQGPIRRERVHEVHARLVVHHDRHVHTVAGEKPHD